MYTTQIGEYNTQAVNISPLKANNLRISMTENGNPKENPQAERINNTIKNELLPVCEFHSLREVNNAIAGALDSITMKGLT